MPKIGVQAGQPVYLPGVAAKMIVRLVSDAHGWFCSATS
jgi:hypothetical protein